MSDNKHDIPGTAPATAETRKQPAAKRPLRLHKAAHDPRAAALVVLHRVLEEQTDSQAALDAVLDSPHLVPTDRGLCTELAYGTLRRHIRLNWFLRRFLTRPERLPAEMILTLETALYEMVYLRTPDHAGVNWAVSHIRNRFGKGMTGVANGVLRSMQRRIAEFDDPAVYNAECGNPQEAAACRFAVPVWLLRLWTDAYGEEKTHAYLEASAGAPPAGLRLNKTVQAWDHLRHNLLQEHPDALQISDNVLAFSTARPRQLRFLPKEGKASRQSAASYEALFAFDPSSWPQPIWDCCSGRGGKTTALLELGIPVALASDVSRKRLSALPQEYARLGLTDPPCPALRLLSAADAGAGFGEPLQAQDTAAPPEQFGTILVDAPCSGLGTLGRRPEIRLRRTPDDLEQLARLQREILRGVWPRLAPGGVLIYLTCTLNPAENEDLVRAFTAEEPSAQMAGEFQTPHDSPLGEFFYAAKLVKQE